MQQILLPPPAPRAAPSIISRECGLTAVDKEDIKKFMEAQPAGFVYSSGETGKNLTYGELTFNGVLQLLRDSHYRRGGVVPQVVLDLGSGTGKVPLTAAAVHTGVRQGIGIELVKDRYDKSVETQEDLNKKFPAVDIKSRTLLLQGDIKTAVAAIAAADVIWMANTCYGESLNEDLIQLIDDYAPDGCLVYMCVPLRFQRAEREYSSASLEVTWVADSKGHGSVAWLKGEPLQLTVLDEEVYSDHFDRAFERWSNSDMLIEGESLRAAVAASLLPEFPADLILQELHTPEGELAWLCEEDITECPDGADADRFARLCSECHHTLHGGDECGSTLGSPWNFSAIMWDLLECRPRVG